MGKKRGGVIMADQEHVENGPTGDKFFVWIIGAALAVAAVDMLVTLTQHQTTNLLTVLVFLVIAALRVFADSFIVAGQQWFLFFVLYTVVALGLGYFWKQKENWVKLMALIIAGLLLIPVFPVGWVTFLAWKL